MAAHHAVGISRQRNSGYRPSRVNIMTQGLSSPSLSLTHLSIRRGRATTTTHYTHHQVSLMVSGKTTLVPSLGLRIGPACEAGVRFGMRREPVSPQIRKKKERKNIQNFTAILSIRSLRHFICHSKDGTENIYNGCQTNATAEASYDRLRF